MISFQSLKVKELKRECKERGIKGYSKLRKKELIEILLRSENKEYKEGLERFTVKELKMMCKERGIKRYSKLKKKEIIKLLEGVEDDDVEVKESEDCPICLCSIKREVKTSCNHSFCGVCIRKWCRNNDSCPLCRKDIKNEVIRNGRRSEVFRERVQEPEPNLGFSMYENVRLHSIVEGFINDLPDNLRIFINELPYNVRMEVINDFINQQQLLR